MNKALLLQRTDLEVAARMLRARARGLQSMAQSNHCPMRTEVELELGRVREQIAANYVEMRKLSAGPAVW